MYMYRGKDHNSFQKKSLHNDSVVVAMYMYMYKEGITALFIKHNHSVVMATVHVHV